MTSVLEGEAISYTEEETSRLGQIAVEIAAGRLDLATVAGISDDELEALYSFAHSFYVAHRYEDARTFFHFLCLHRYSDPRFWFGFGAASQMLGETASAVRAYGLAALLNSDEPQIPLRAAECLIQLGEPDAAADALQSVLTLAADSPDHAAYVQRAQMMLNKLTTEMSAKKGAAVLAEPS